MTRRIELAAAIKHQAIRQHFVDGVPWQDTDLFRLNYVPRLVSGPVRGQRTLVELVKFYERRVDPLYASMKRHGFDRTARKLPHVLIGREGDIFLASQGNHRIAIAKLLGIPTVPCRVQCRHSAWLPKRAAHPEHPDHGA